MALAEERIRLAERRYTPAHGRVAMALQTKARLLERLGRCRDAVPLHRRAVDIFRANHGAARITAAALRELSGCLRLTGETAAGKRTAHEALAMAASLYPAGAQHLANYYPFVANVAGDEGDLARVEAYYAAAQKIFEDKPPRDVSAYGIIAIEQGWWRLAFDRCPEAMIAVDTALSHASKARQLVEVTRLQAATIRGECERRGGRARDAVRTLRAAADLARVQGTPVTLPPLVDFFLARAEHDVGDDRLAASRRARAARDAYVAVDPDPRWIGEMNRYLAGL